MRIYELFFKRINFTHTFVVLFIYMGASAQNNRDDLATARLYYQQGNYPQAQKAASAFLKKSTKNQSDESRLQARILLAATHSWLSRYEQAYTIFQQLLPIATAASPATRATLWREIGWWHYLKTNYDSAYLYTHRALVVYPDTNQKDYTDALHNLAVIADSRQQADATTLFQQVLAKKMALFSSDQAGIANTLNEYADYLRGKSN